MSQSNNVQDLKEKVNLLVKQSRWVDSERILRKMLAMDPSNDSVLRKIGQVNEQLNNMNDAKYYYEKAMKINPKNIYTLKKLALLYHHQFDYISKAEKYYIKCIDINPNDDEIHFNLAILYTKQKQYTKARQSFLKCDYRKAAVNYHYGVYLLAVNKDQNALELFRLAIDIKPRIANYHFEYAKLCTKLGKIKKANESFIQALNLCQHQEAKILFEYGLFCKYKHEDNTNAIFYIDLALKLKPNRISYKYMQLKCHNEQETDINDKYILRKRCVRSSELDDEDTKFSIKNVIQKRAELLLSGYINYSSRSNSVYVPFDISLVMRSFFIDKFGNYAEYLHSVCHYLTLSYHYDILRYFSEFGKNEIIVMLFDVLCPGRDETKIIFTITKLIDLIRVFQHGPVKGTKLEHMAPFDRIYFLLLLSMSTITNVYDILSMTNETKHYINYKREIIQIFCKEDRWNSTFLLELFNQNDAFFPIFKSLLREKTINIDVDYIEYLPTIYWIVPSNLKYLLLLCIASLFGNCEPDYDFNIDRSAIEILYEYAVEYAILLNDAGHYFWIARIVPLLRVVRLEIESLNEHLNYELQIAVDKILGFIWHIITTTKSKNLRQRFDATVEICRNAGLTLKNFSSI